MTDLPTPLRKQVQSHPRQCPLTRRLATSMEVFHPRPISVLDVKVVLSALASAITPAPSTLLIDIKVQ